MLCIYHIADHDGKGSAAIVKNLFPETELFGLNHDMEIPYEEIRRHDKIIVCDIALPLNFMFELSQTKDFTWIDHHASVINDYNAAMEQGGHSAIKGLRRVGTAAICLTWEYFHPGEPIPEGVVLIGLNDIFDLRNPDVRPFEYGFQSLGVNRPGDETWTKMLNGTLDIPAVIEKGQAVLSWIKIRNIRLSHGLTFASEYQGLKCLCSNMPQGYSEFYDSVPGHENYDFLCNFYMNKNNCWNLSFYTSKENIDVSRIAAAFGGGGHQKAAGASKLKALPEFLLCGGHIK